MKQFVRKLIGAAVESVGYRVSGNHIFAAADYVAIERGNWRKSVSEAPERHAARVVRFAELLARTY